VTATILDRALGWVSPKLGADRMKSRAMMRYYDGASKTGRTAGWKSPGGDANEAARQNGPLRLNARDMVRNNAIARRAVAALVDNIVGDGIIPSVEASSDRLKRQVMDLMLRHTDSVGIDASGRTNLYGLQRLAVAGMVTDGEVLLRRRSRLMTDPRRPPLSFQLQMLEPEWIDDRMVGLLQSGNRIVDGIEYDTIGRRVAYHLYREDPRAMVPRGREVARVPADAVIHLFRQDRPEQMRGVSWLAPVMSLIADAYDYADAQLVRQKIAALWVGFTKDTLGDAPAPERTMSETLYPGMFEHLPPGRDVTFADPPAAEGYAEHMKAVQRMIAAALCLTYEELSGDLEGVNFSSARIGRIAMQRAVSAVQWTLVMPALCEPMGAWLRESISEQITTRGDWRIKWTPPRFPMTDPAREIPAMVDEIDAGLSSRTRKIRELGFDPEEIDAEIAEDREKRKRIGLPPVGGAANAAAPAAAPTDADAPAEGEAPTEAPEPAPNN
jgi:lambda family phage portal protein